MALLTGMTADGLEVPVQVLPDGKLVAEGLEGPAGKAGEAAAIGGTAALPGLHPPGDENTGLFSPGPDQLSVSLSGVPGIFLSPGQIGIGEAPTSKAPTIRIAGPLTGAANRRVLTMSAQIMPDVTVAATGYSTYIFTEAAQFDIGLVVHFVSEQGPLGAGSRVNTQVGFSAGASLIGGLVNYGYLADIPAGTNRWNIYCRGTADSWFASNNFILANGNTERARFNEAGQLLIGSNSGLAGSTAKLQCASTINLSVGTYADNAAAKTAGLVPGDVYRKADGTLMIAF